jgi:uncharacterized protein (DUF58 family)
MKLIKHTTNWLETRACAPAYSGWVLAGISICFFGAAVNTMAGWLYVLSGISFALLGVAAVLPPRSLSGLVIKRNSIEPVTAGNDLTIELEIVNPSKQAVNLLQVQDTLPFVLGKPLHKAIETISAGGSYHWLYYHPTNRRGIYRWHTVELRSGAPMGLFWCRRLHNVPAKAIVYPPVLPLTTCPLLDDMGEEDNKIGDYHSRLFQTANQGQTRSLRPYRVGDPMRLIHWRTSARYGELRVRDLEVVTGGQDVIIALDSAGHWEEENFEQAVITAVSLYFYAHRNRMQVSLWTALTGVVKGERIVLETLAATTATEDSSHTAVPRSPLLWLTQNPQTLSSLPNGSRWVFWQSVSSSQEAIVNRNFRGMIVDSLQPLQPQLQKPLNP